ncbi:MAG: hypothetical protein JOZ15_17680 [Acidobacteria bacterium]|nr:hypothetical protein [Acidobacteriota bacterium]
MRIRLIVLVAALGVGHVALLGTLAAPASAQRLSGKLLPRRFYVSLAPGGLGVNGSGPITACAQGFHFASIDEIFNPTQLAYDSSQAFAYTAADMGAGAPHGYLAWVRTGNGSSTLSVAGEGNCSVWASGSGADSGTVVALKEDWAQPPQALTPYVAQTTACNVTQGTWCVED